MDLGFTAMTKAVSQQDEDGKGENERPRNLTATKREEPDEERREEILSLRWATAGRVIRTSTSVLLLYCFGIGVAEAIECSVACPEPAGCSGSCCCCFEFQDRLTAPVRYAKRAGSQTTRPARRRQSYFFLALRAVFFFAAPVLRAVEVLARAVLRLAVFFAPFFAAFFIAISRLSSSSVGSGCPVKA